MATSTVHPNHQLISSEDVEGTNVYDLSGKKIGEIDHLIIDKLSGRVTYAVMSFGGFIGLGHSHYPIPWAALKYDTKLNGYVTGITEKQLKDAPAFSDNSWRPQLGDPDLQALQRQPLLGVGQQGRGHIGRARDASRRQVELHRQAKAPGRTYRGGLRAPRRSRRGGRASGLGNRQQAGPRWQEERLRCWQTKGYVTVAQGWSSWRPGLG